MPQETSRHSRLHFWIKSTLFLSTSFYFLSQEVSGNSDKLPIPRFVSLRSNKVNTHVGPGKNYPIQWVYVKQHMPVEVIAQFDTWRQIRDVDGVTAWVHRSLLSGKRTVLIRQQNTALKSSPSEDASTVATLGQGLIGLAKECRESWCKVNVKGYVGWIQRSKLWGVYAKETKF